jgi:hypothetical protein
LDVTFTSENVTNDPPDADPPTLTYLQTGPLNWEFQVGGNIPTGTHYLIFLFFQGNPGIGETYGVFQVVDYTSIGGDTASDVATAISGQFNAYASVPVLFSITFGGGTGVTLQFGAPGIVMQVVVNKGGGGGGTISTEKTWLWDANYIFGQGYKDEQGRLMPGVTTLVNPVSANNDYLVTTLSFSVSGTSAQTPVIYAEINHLPYPGSVSVAYCRRRTTYGNILFYMTCDFQDPGDGFYYFCLANIEAYKAANSQFIYGTAPITSESRIKLVAGISGGGYDGDVYAEDYEILGTVTKKLTGGTSPQDDKTFIKVKTPTTPPATAYEANMLVFVYTPLANPTDITDSVFNEWGEEYPNYNGYTIIASAISGNFTVGETITGGTSGATAVFVGQDTGLIGVSDVTGTFQAGETLTGGTSTETATFTSISGPVLYHTGGDQDQTSFQPATFSWEEGDVYFHVRTMYNDIKTASGPAFPSDTVSVMDANFSDFFSSAVNDNGRGLSIEVNARETYFPATIRFSREYQQNTNINQTNRFFFNNFIDLDRSFGDIFKMSIKDRYIRIGQRFKIGVVPIFNQISKDSGSNTILAATDVLLNPVQYYAGDYGVGEAASSWVDYNFSSYFFDTNRGIWCRLSQDGIVPISILYKINSWATEHGPLRVGNYKIYGTFDPRSNNCIMAFEATDTDAAYTLAFDEENNSVESFLSYFPDMMATLGNLLITWKDGDLWTHDSSVYNNFYGVQYPSSITPVWNDKPAIKKVFNAISYRSNEVFESPVNGDIFTSMINPQTGLQQQSQLKTVDYEIQENVRYAAFMRDANSMSDARLALCEGDFLLGDWVATKLIVPANKANKLVFLSSPYVTSEISQRNF